MQPLAKLYLKLESTSQQPCGIEDRAVDLPAPADISEFTEDTRRRNLNFLERISAPTELFQRNAMLRNTLISVRVQQLAEKASACVPEHTSCQ